jgi:hypothetical protein
MASQMTQRDAMQSQLEWCQRERDQSAKSLEMFEQGIMKFGSISATGELKDGTEQLKDDNRRIIAEMDRLIEVIKRDLESGKFDF